MSDWRDELAEIAECELCDDKGKRLDSFRLACDHVDRAAIYKRGMDKLRQTMGWQ